MGSSYYRARGRQILSGNWGMAILVTFVAGIFGAGAVSASSTSFSLDINLDIPQQLPEPLSRLPLILFSFASIMGIVQFILSGVVRLGYCKYMLKLHDGEHADIKDLFSEFNRFGDAFVLSLLKGLYVSLWSLLFVIPGIIAIYKYAMSFFILLEHPGMRPRDALDASEQMMDGHKASLFWLGMSFIGWEILCTFTLGIGYLWLYPYANAAQTAFYRNLCPRTFPQQEAPFTLTPEME
jgi:uncharacterized membrane protein